MIDNMKTLISIFFASFLLSFDFFGQDEVLVLKNTINGEYKMIQDGRRVKIYCKDGSTYKGKLISINDSIIKIDSVNLTLGRIEAIKICSPFSGIFGGVLTGYGVFSDVAVIVFLVHVFIVFPEIFPLDLILGALFLVPNNIPTLIGIILMKRKKYDKSNWQFHIIKK